MVDMEQLELALVKQPLSLSCFTYTPIADWNPALHIWSEQVKLPRFYIYALIYSVIR